MPLPCGAGVSAGAHEHDPPERDAHVGILLHFGHAFQHATLRRFQELLYPQDARPARPLHPAFAPVPPARPSLVQLRPVPEGAAHDHHEHPPAYRERLGLHLLEPREDFRGRQILHRVGAALVRVHALLGEPYFLWGASDCKRPFAGFWQAFAEQVRNSRPDNHRSCRNRRPRGRLAPVQAPHPAAARNRARPHRPLLLRLRVSPGASSWQRPSRRSSSTRPPKCRTRTSAS